MDEQYPSTPPDNNPASRNQAGQRRNKTAGTGNDMSNFVFGKVQPQALTLEEAVLGAIMLDKDTLPIILDILKPESFYSDIHQLIYRAMLGLFDKSHPIDLLTVTEELKKSGDLEKIGGPYFLVELTNRVASAANIEYHARIIAQKHIQRELIRVSTQIIRDAYEDTTDVFNLMDDAERGLFAITEHNLTRSFESMGSLSSKLLKQIEDLSKRKDGLTGVPTGFVELDRMTSGWQPSDLIIMAARPGMGKTSFVLSVARNAALEFGKPVALFSLEMSNLQLVQRLVSMESEVPATKLRNGQLEDYEWTMIQQTIEKLSTAPIFIDDTPGINIFELRAKCRRLKMQHNIELIIIDYLQLMSGTGEGGRGGNREQEVSNISRSLKGLAKELGVPVIALSQLSRAVETRGGTKRPQLSDLRESGCLAGDTLVFNALTGGTVPIRDLAEQWEPDMNFHCLALNNDLKLTPRPVIKAFYSGQKEVFEITTATGRKIKASANHPFLKLTGWTRLDQLSAGDRLAVPGDIGLYSDSAASDFTFDQVNALKSSSGNIYKKGQTALKATLVDTLYETEVMESTSDIYWDKILSIEPLGIEDVYDLTVPEDHNFVANDFIVHNSIEQDADIVTFIYRPEYYNILEDEEGNSMKGVAEILIAKHRNGSLGTVKLRFIDRFAKFDDLDDPHFNELPFDAPKAIDAGDSNASQVITRSSRMNDEDIPF